MAQLPTRTLADDSPQTHLDDTNELIAGHNLLDGHLAASDPHPNYERENQKGQASGYAGLDGSAKVPLAQLPTGTTASTVALGDAVANHEAAANPHVGYPLRTERGTADGYASLDGTVKVPADQLGGAGGSSGNYLRGDRAWGDPVAPHVAASDPHSGSNYVIMASGGGRRIYVQDTEPTGMQAGDIWIETDAAAAVGALDDLSDVVITAAASGEVLRHNGTNWVDATLSADDLSDVAISAAATGDIFRHNGTSFVNSQLGTSLFVRRTTDAAARVNNTIADDTVLTLNVAANAVYIMRAFIIGESSLVADLQVGWATTATGATLDWTAGVPGNITAATVTAATYQFSNKTVGQVVTATMPDPGTTLAFQPAGLLVTAGTAGALTFRWAQGTTDAATNTTIKAGSFLHLLRVG